MVEARSHEADDWWDAAKEGRQDRLPDGAPPVDALKPLDDDERARMTEALFGVAPQAEVVDLAAKRRSRIRLGAAAGFAAAAAAAVVLFVTAPSTPALPEYAMVVRSGEKVVRSDTPTTDDYRYVAGSHVDVIVRPRVTVEGTAHLSAVAVDADGTAHSWTGPVVTRDGAFRVGGTFGEDVNLEPGAWRLVLVVSSDPIADPTASWATPPTGARVVEHRFQLEPTSSGTPPGVPSPGDDP
ncbi:MAG: hypothetical protein RIT81_45355 [Deltaproteobacteria bacterium]